MRVRQGIAISHAVLLVEHSLAIRACTRAAWHAPQPELGAHSSRTRDGLFHADMAGGSGIDRMVRWAQDIQYCYGPAVEPASIYLSPSSRVAAASILVVPLGPSLRPTCVANVSGARDDHSVAC